MTKIVSTNLALKPAGISLPVAQSSLLYWNYWAADGRSAEWFLKNYANVNGASGTLTGAAAKLDFGVRIPDGASSVSTGLVCPANFSAVMLATPEGAWTSTAVSNLFMKLSRGLLFIAVGASNNVLGLNLGGSNVINGPNISARKGKPTVLFVCHTASVAANADTGAAAVPASVTFGFYDPSTGTMAVSTSASEIAFNTTLMEFGSSSGYAGPYTQYQGGLFSENLYASGKLKTICDFVAGFGTRRGLAYA